MNTSTKPPVMIIQGNINTMGPVLNHFGVITLSLIKTRRTDVGNAIDLAFERR
jgi:hypothetical protein